MEQFVIRVYGLIINTKKEVLISDEYVLNTHMTKFPGGGLEFGEGTVDCLKREFREECNKQELTNIRHFYTTDLYQKALYYENAQLLSIYYLADLKAPVKFKITNKPFDFDIIDDWGQSFRWVQIREINEDEITFPIDRIVVKKLKKQYL
jgi:ADP-ribose pyrophosphatase YjhB (NUDIX family)